MKKLFLSISLVFTLLLTMSAFQAHAAQRPTNFPLLSKSAGTGFVLPELRSSQQCDIYADHVEVRNYSNGLSGIETKNYKVDATALRPLAKKVAEAKRNESTGPTDGPTTVYTLYFVQGTIPVPVIYSQTGDKRVESEAKEAVTLKGFTTLLCGF